LTWRDFLYVGSYRLRKPLKESCGSR